MAYQFRLVLAFLMVALPACGGVEQLPAAKGGSGGEDAGNTDSHAGELDATPPSDAAPPMRPR